MATGIDSLPDEIFGEIFSYFLAPTLRPWPLDTDTEASLLYDCSVARKSNKSELLSYSLVSKRCSILARPMLFHSITIDNTRMSTLLKTPLVDHPLYIHPLVRNLDISLPTDLVNYATVAQYSRVKEAVLRLDDFEEIDVTNIASTLSAMPELCALTLIFDKWSWDESGGSAKVSMLYASLADILGKNSYGLGKSLQTIEIRNAFCTPSFDALISFIASTSVRNVSLWNCAFPVNSAYLETLVQLDLEALSLDTSLEWARIRITGLQSFTSLRKLRIGFRFGEGATQVANVLPQQIMELHLFDQEYLLVECLLERLAHLPHFLPKLEILRVGASNGDPFDVFTEADNEFAGEDQYRHINSL